MSAPRNSNAKDLEAFEPKDKGIAHTDHARAVLSASRTDSSMSEAPYAEHGVLIDRSPTVDLKKKAGLGLFWPKFRLVLREPFSEFLGTFILVMFGDGAIAQVVLSNGTKGSWQSINWGFGIGLMLGVYVAGISGAHLNPAVTFANCIYRKFPWRKFPTYMVAQILGAMCAAAVIYGNYRGAIDAFEGGSGVRTVPGYSQNATAGIFGTYPAEFMTRSGAFWSEMIGSALLMFMIYALKDDANLGAGNLTPLALFFVMFGIGACFGWETGFALNTARDFGPRLISHAVGYGHHVWSAGGYYFWIPMVAPFVGCTLGGFIYDFLVFTGESPLNTAYLGFYRVMPGIDEHGYHTEKEQDVSPV